MRIPKHKVGVLLSLLTTLALWFLTGCLPYDKTNNLGQTEKPHLYWKEIDVVISDIDKRHWYASGHHYTIDLTVRSDEYGLSESFSLNGMDAAAKWEYSEGDTVKAELFSWVIDSTGEVTKREINQVY